MVLSLFIGVILGVLYKLYESKIVLWWRTNVLPMLQDINLPDEVVKYSIHAPIVLLSILFLVGGVLKALLLLAGYYGAQKIWKSY
jgi:hypothetical protein